MTTGQVGVLGELIHRASTRPPKRRSVESATSRVKMSGGRSLKGPLASDRVSAVLAKSDQILDTSASSYPDQNLGSLQIPMARIAHLSPGIWEDSLHDGCESFTRHFP